MTKFSLRLILVLMWVIFIFSMSAFKGDESSEMSQGVGYVICEMTVKNFDTMPKEEQRKIVKSIEHPIRKTAHFTEYAVLGALLYFTLKYYKQNNTAVILSWIGCTLYAASDEFHQIFVSGRTPQFTDICIDSAGAFIGIIFLGCLLKMFKKIKANC
ncbi:MAG: VanZ family protein [Clostridia bacterium]|nr:VanZ family protein [Clostridia bacterium]MCI1999618.1 VanZ family protein [Clostridia bacterium]MCI2014003.1 VanZ family protein [Clostridia bacterium]